MTLGCRAFFREFLAEFKKERKRTKWEQIYYKNRVWTAKMLHSFLLSFLCLRLAELFLNSPYT